MCHISFLGLGVGNMSNAVSSPDFIMFKVYWGQQTKIRWKEDMSALLSTEIVNWMLFGEYIERNWVRKTFEKVTREGEECTGRRRSAAAGRVFFEGMMRNSDYPLSPNSRTNAQLSLTPSPPHTSCLNCQQLYSSVFKVLLGFHNVSSPLPWPWWRPPAFLTWIVATPLTDFKSPSQGSLL